MTNLLAFFKSSKRDGISFQIISEQPFFDLKDAPDCTDRVVVDIPETCVRLVVPKADLSTISALMKEYPYSPTGGYYSVWAPAGGEEVKLISGLPSSGGEESLFGISFATCSRNKDTTERCSDRVSKLLKGMLYYDRISSVSCKEMRAAEGIKYDNRVILPSIGVSVDEEMQEDLDENDENNSKEPCKESNKQTGRDELRSIDNAIDVIKTAKVDDLIPNSRDNSVDETIKQAIEILLRVGMKKPNRETYPPTLVLAWRNILLAAVHFWHSAKRKPGRELTPTGDLVFGHLATHFGRPSFVPNKALEGVLACLRGAKAVSLEKINLWVADHPRPITLTAMKEYLRTIQED